MSETDFPYEMVDVVSVEPRGAFRLGIRFSNGEEGERDFSDMIEEGGVMVEPLCDLAFFSRVRRNSDLAKWF